MSSHTTLTSPSLVLESVIVSCKPVFYASTTLRTVVVEHIIQPLCITDERVFGCSFMRRGGSTFENLNPATEELICHCPNAQAEDVDEAVAAARAW